MNSDLISKAVRYALVAGAVSAVSAPAVYAQDQAASNQNQNQTNTAQLGKIEVTGTRIKRTEVETAQPVTIITKQELQQSGLTSIGDILQTLTQSGAALNTVFNNGGNGQTHIDLRFLGANRVLVLVNGRRWIPQLNGPVDLNEIPASIIDHVEILQDGASAIYGSDAIAGVVNIITVKNYNGAEANAYYGIYHENKYGLNKWDGKSKEFDFTLGSSGDRAGVVMNVSYLNDDPIWAGSRAQSKEPIWTQGSQTGSSATPAGRFFLVGSALAGKTFGQATCAPYNTAVHSYGSCDMTLINTPTNTPTTGNFRNFTNPDHYNYAPANYFVTPSERTGAYIQGHYDLADNLTFTTELLYNRRVSQQSLAPSPIFIGLGSYTANGKFVGIGAANPYNPFGVDLVANLSQYCPTTPSKINVATQGCSSELLAFTGRRPIESGFRYFNQNVNTFFFRAGFNGYFNLLGSEWDWDIGYSFGNNYETDVTQGLWNTERLAIALDSPGFPSCASTPGCVPFNWFGGYNQATGQGSITPAMLQYVQYEDHAVQANNMRDYTADITGDLAQLPAGPLGVALGTEYLEYDGFQHPDATTSSGNTSGNVTQPTDGRQWSNAEYIEFNIPLVADAPLFKSLSLDIANRWSQYKWQGGEASSPFFNTQYRAHASTGRAALKWQPTDTLLLRASWSQGFRAPSLSDLYFGNSDNFPSVSDPCAPPPAGSWAPGVAPACPTAPTHTQPNAQIKSTVGGNPGLTPERAISRTAGFVYSPNWLPGFDFSADYYKIVLSNEISVISPQTILNGCYISQNPQFCNLITVSGKFISDIKDTNVNIGGVRTRGVDVSTHYKFPSTSLGDFKLGLDWTFLQSYVTTIPNPISPTGFSSTELAGTTTAFGGFPRQKANLSLNWNYGNWSAVWHVQYIYSMYESCSKLTKTLNECSNPTAPYPLGGIGENHLGKTLYHDVQGTYHVDSINTDLTFGIRNIFDKQPPAALTAFANSFLPTFYRVPGRFFYGRVSVKF